MDNVIHVNLKNLILLFLMMVVLGLVFSLGAQALGWGGGAIPGVGTNPLSQGSGG
jgi:hypothetical protein